MEYSNSQIHEVINEYIHSEKERYILYERLVNGLTAQTKYFLQQYPPTATPARVA